MFLRRLPKFEYHSPATVEEALNLKCADKGTCKFLAGGTDLLVDMHKHTTLVGLDAATGEVKWEAPTKAEAVPKGGGYYVGSHKVVRSKNGT